MWSQKELKKDLRSKKEIRDEAKAKKAAEEATRAMARSNEKRYDNSYTGVNVTEIAGRMFKVDDDKVTPKQAEKAWEAYLAVLHTQPAIDHERVALLRRREQRLNSNYDAFSKEQAMLRRDVSEARRKVHGLEETIRLQAEALGTSGIEGFQASLKIALAELINFVPEMHPEAFNNKNIYYRKGNEGAPFGSETHLYIQYGKDDGRTVLAILRELCELAGVSGPNDLFLARGDEED